MNRSLQPRVRRWPRRRVAASRGAVLVAALVCLLVVMGIIGGMLRGALGARRQLHAERDLRQTELLVEAGADRAVLRLAVEPSYNGETWQIPSDQIINRGDAIVTIRASRSSVDKPWQVRVVAEYPAGSELSIRRSRTFELSISASP